MTVVNPSDFIPQLVIWSTFNIFAACGLGALLVVTLVVQGSRANLTLLNLEIIFILSSSTNIFVLAAFVAGVIALSSSFNAVIPDIIVSSLGVGAFFIFASAAPIVRFVFCCQRDPAWRSTLQPLTRTGSRSWPSGRGTHSELGTHIEPPQEFNLFKIQGQREQKPAIYIIRDMQIREDKI
ncbi:hypothetical protein B0H17DRAFT_1215145 [Mycena rosella]|uniref:Uncharacterized protein n=1 Tax=Mycena rosella TaxID=1033263 RepID=A0AAD7CLI3_MYCRO|nr:hypothetical protein B0H17DRAFT_1215145 [Mycena rosella]